jgi:hypothetical protein
MITKTLISLKKLYAKLFSEKQREKFHHIRQNNVFLIFFPFKYLNEKLWLLYCYFNAYKLSDYLYYDMFKKHINWENPKDINEKMQWLKFYSDTSKWSELADKYKVREWVKSKGLENILNELYIVFKNEKEIDLYLLPQSFVLKTNNGCRDRLIIRDKSHVNLKDIQKHFRKVRKNNKYFARSAEHYYLKIKPRVILAEKLLVDNKSSSEIVIDYKFFCFHGEPKYVEIINGRSKSSQDTFQLQIFDMNWNYLEGVIKDEPKNNIFNKCEKPESFEEMKKICKILSADFPFVRVDLYNIEGKPVFGEMTLTPSAGREDDYNDDFLYKIGCDVDLTKVKKLKNRNRS